MTQNQQQTNGRSVQDRIERELADSFDEELEMEIDDDRLAKLLAQTVDYPEREELDRRVYFKELFLFHCHGFQFLTQFAFAHVRQ
jgi:hypothetical protein